MRGFMKKNSVFKSFFLSTPYLPLSKCFLAEVRYSFASSLLPDCLLSGRSVGLPESASGRQAAQVSPLTFFGMRARPPARLLPKMAWPRVGGQEEEEEDTVFVHHDGGAGAQ